MPDVPELKELTAWLTEFASIAVTTLIVMLTTLGEETSMEIRSVPATSVILDVLLTLPALLALTVTRMVAVLPVLLMPTVYPTMDLSQWEPTLFVVVVFVLILTLALLLLMTTLDVSPTLDVLTAKLMDLARPVHLTLIVVFSMEELSLDNLGAKVMEPVDLVKLTLIALPLPPTVVLMEVAMLVLLDPTTKNVDLSMEEKSLTNLTVTLSLTSVSTSVHLMMTALMIALPTVT